MKKLPPAPMRTEDEPGYQKEIWQPSWTCFCCHDSGRVMPYLAQLMIDEYEYDKHKLPRCQNPSCDSGNYWDGDSVIDSIDYRFTSHICQELDDIERLGWQKTISLQNPLIREELAKLCQQKNLRRYDCPSGSGGANRTPDEDRASFEKHIAALALCEKETLKQEESDTDSPDETECEEVCL